MVGHPTSLSLAQDGAHFAQLALLLLSGEASPGVPMTDLCLPAPVLLPEM